MSMREGTDLGCKMSNCGHTIDDGFAEELIAGEGKVYGRYAGWDFHAAVYYEAGRFFADVWCYGHKNATLSALSLPQLMNVVSDRFGAA